MTDWKREDPTWLSMYDGEGNRITIHPSEVRGRFQRARGWVQAVLLSFYVILPWVRVGGKQGLLLDIGAREFAFFGLTFRAHDAPMLLFPVLGFTLFVALVTALYGRVWCGWACPQTVFIEAVFRRIESWFEGPAVKRRWRDQQPPSVEKFARRAGKWTAFVLVSLVITHTALALFIGADRVLQAVQRPPSEAWPAFLFIATATLVILVDFGWLREQFCVFACPYGRIQSLFTDRATRTVAYDDKRTDCVNCFRCVQVCPTGIDIRQGAGQLECIACTACIDACDDVMAKVHRPTKLIRYAAAEPGPLFRPRTALYATMLLALAAGFLALIRERPPLSAEFLKTRGAPFEVVPSPEGDWISNSFHAELSNRTDRELVVELSLEGARLIAPGNPYTLRAGEIRQMPFVVEAKPGAFHDGRLLVKLTLRNSAAAAPLIRELTLVGPYHYP